jgi:hypothetical protein
MLGRVLLLALFALPPAASAAAVRVEENPCAADLDLSLRRISSGHHSDLSLWTNGQVPGRYYTQDPRAHFGFNNHFQGVERLRDSNFMVISGGLIQEHQAQLFVAEMRSRSEEGDFGGNLDRRGSPPPEDGMISRIDFDDPAHWHAGGLARLGDVVIVPLTDDVQKVHTISIVFYDFSDPLNPKKIATEIDRPTGEGIVGAEKLPDGRFIVVTHYDDALHFHYSRSARLEDGFEDPVVSEKSKVSRGYYGEGIQLIRQCDGRLFYLDFNNDGAVPPLINGTDRVRLHEVLGVTGSRADRITVKLKAEIPLDCGDSCNFAAAAGITVADDHRIRIYSTYFFRNFRGTQLRFAEFAE